MASPQLQLDPSLVRFGTSSFSSKDWVGPFYPAGCKPSDFLSHYAAVFNTVEIDASYYAIPSKAMVDGWVSKTPEDFKISLKFPQSIVHAGDGPQPDAATLLTEAVYADRDLFLKTVERLGDRLHTLLLQFPYFSKQVFDDAGAFLERLDEFLTDLPAEFRYAVEIRNRSWLTPDFAHLLRSHSAALVLVDQAWMPHGDEVEDRFNVVTSDQAYIRLLGDRREIEAITQAWDTEVIDRRERLQRWAAFLVRMLRRGLPTVVYVNNHYAGHAPTTVRRLAKMFEAAVEANG
jgi:uncharacterized protein YecE (DUF72 family)